MTNVVSDKKSIYLINPKAEHQAYFSADVYAGWGLTPTTLIADLVTPTIAAMVPDTFNVSLCDEHLTPVDFDTPVDFVALTGKTSQTRRMLEIAREFRRRGRTIIIGGPVATLDPDAVRDYCDILVQGEIEEIGPVIFGDLLSGRWQASYQGGKPELTSSPIPRWDLYPNDQAINGCVQTSRGCPFECEFCDVPAFVGRKQRYKNPDQVLAELDVLYALGYRAVFLADDNFTVYRQRAKALLVALRAWNERQTDGFVSFSTQVSIDAARDDELLMMCAKAGINMVFIGIESPNMESLRESGKRQNVGRDLIADVQRFLDHHIMVISGLIVGFDADGPEIFEVQRQFIQSSPIPIFSLGALVAPAQTPLRTRLAAEGRLVDDEFSSTATPWHTNIIPKQMSREELLRGLRGLSHEIYGPQAFGERVVSLIKRLGPYVGPRGTNSTVTNSQIQRDTVELIKMLVRLGVDEQRMAKSLLKAALSSNPEALDTARAALRFYAQVRYVYAQMD